MPDVLIAYAGSHGHTERIARRLASAFTATGAAPRLADLREDDPPNPSAFDRVVVAASIHAGRHQRAAVDFIRAHRTALGDRPSALLSVSLTAAEDSAEARATTARLVDDLLVDTGWTPSFWLAVAGALRWSRYDLATRTMMRVIARKHGAPTDGDDVVFTDWPAVEAVAPRLLAVRAPRPVPAVSATS